MLKFNFIFISIVTLFFITIISLNIFSKSSVNNVENFDYELYDTGPPVFANNTAEIFSKVNVPCLKTRNNLQGTGILSSGRNFNSQEAGCAEWTLCANIFGDSIECFSSDNLEQLEANYETLRKIDWTPTYLDDPNNLNYLCTHLYPPLGRKGIIDMKDKEQIKKAMGGGFFCPKNDSENERPAPDTGNEDDMESHKGNASDTSKSLQGASDKAGSSSGVSV